MTCVRRGIACLLICVGTLLFAATANAADIRFKSANDGTTIIALSGEIVEGDSKKFDDSISALRGTAVVVLSSDGGLALEGMAIGESIRARRYSTAVVNGSMCASACGFIWLAGNTRYIGRTGGVGFHAVYIGDGTTAKETGLGNALLGAYLTKLGLSYSAVAFVTSTGPESMRWLTPDNAKRSGIEYVLLPDPVPEAKPSASSGTSEDLPAGSVAEQRAMRVVLSYFQFWSQAGTNVDGLNKYFSDPMSFYGTNSSREKVMVEKTKFSVRWPVRRYVAKMRSLFAQCSDVCAVTGVVEWDVNSPERNARSTGSANFALKIALDNSPIGGRIVSENGSVLSNQTTPLSSGQSATAPMSAVPTPSNSQGPSGTPAFSQGRQARIDFERWMESLVSGAYREGASFWTANRSMKPGPSCEQAGNSPDWQRGCAAARAWLASSDKRRLAEPEFRLGWNSL